MRHKLRNKFIKFVEAIIAEYDTFNSYEPNHVNSDNFKIRNPHYYFRNTVQADKKSPKKKLYYGRKNHDLIFLDYLLSSIKQKSKNKNHEWKKKN